jgi:hypothetical protein
MNITWWHRFSAHTGLAEDSPVILLIDDAQWVDRPSSEVLAFIARRLDAERAVMLLAVREGHDTVLNDAGLPELPVAELDDDAAMALLEATAPQLGQAVRDRLLVEAGGNPLALVELPVALSGGSVPQAPMPLLPITRRLERTFLSRALGLPDPTQAILLIAAADDGVDLTEILRAAELLDSMALSVGCLEPDRTGRA